MKGKLIGLALTAILAACSKPQDAAKDDGGVTAEDLQGASGNSGEWLSYGRTQDEQRYSPLEKINARNVKDLGLAWSAEFDTNRGQEATPLVIDGKIYVTTAWSKVYAYDARTGKQLWFYDPKVEGASAPKGCCDVVNRGLAAYGNSLFLGAFDGRLIALDRATGAVKWSTQTVDTREPYTVTGAPRVVKGKVIIGNGGAELGVRGYVAAYDPETGKQLWRFYTVPGDPAKPFEQPELAEAAKTWAGEWWKLGGGGTVWDAMAYDPELDLLYIGTGNGSPWNHRMRSKGKGDNLYLSSIVALKPDTGKYVWHYQTTPGESWDFTATQHIILADLKIGDETKKVLMQAPKNGFFYVLDRATGKLISANNFVPVTWAKGIDKATGRPIEVPEARYEKTPYLMLPTALGAHNWQPMAFSQKTGLVYIPAQEIPGAYTNEAGFAKRQGLWNTGIDHQVFGLPDDLAARKAVGAMIKGRLIAWDPVRQKEVWRAERPSLWNGGVLATAGNLVFQGTIDGRFVAHAADTGKELWSFKATDSVMAAPATWEMDGEQYVAVIAGRGGSAPLVVGAAMPGANRQGNPMGRLMVFKLDGKATLPASSFVTQDALDLKGVTVDASSVAAGAKTFAANCAVCHGMSALNGGVTPDLRYSPIITDKDAFAAIVLDGERLAAGMPTFKAHMDARSAEAVRAYIVTEARRTGAAK